MYANRGRRLVFVSSIWRNKKVLFEISLSRGAVKRKRKKEGGAYALLRIYIFSPNPLDVS